MAKSCEEEQKLPNCVLGNLVVCCFLHVLLSAPEDVAMRAGSPVRVQGDRIGQNSPDPSEAEI